MAAGTGLSCRSAMSRGHVAATAACPAALPQVDVPRGLLSPAWVSPSAPLSILARRDEAPR